METTNPSTDSTVITATRLVDVQWLNGWDALRGKVNLRYPCIWLVESSENALPLMPNGPVLLSDEELLRASRFLRAAHAVRFRVAHTVLRLLLARATNVEESDIRLGKGHHNKPVLLNPPETELGFNLSYTENYIMVGLHDHFPIGVDIEWLSRPFDFEFMSQACFSKQEIEFINSADHGTQERFFTLWTRKEAVLKLTGEGINDQLPAFEVLDGPNLGMKEDIGGHSMDEMFLYSFSIGADLICSVALPAPLSKLWCYRL